MLLETHSMIPRVQTQDKNFLYAYANIFKPGWLKLDFESNFVAFPGPDFSLQ